MLPSSLESSNSIVGLGLMSDLKEGFGRVCLKVTFGYELGLVESYVW